MKLLLDTHVLIGVIEKRAAVFDRGIKDALEAPESEFYVSVASLWEIAIKWRLGKLRLHFAPVDLPEVLEAMGIDLLPIGANHVLASIDPEPATRDPFDRLLLAKCKVEGLRLLTSDRALIRHPFALKPEA